VEKYCRAGQATDDNIVRRMRFACWIPKATNTHSEYETFIAFPRQQWLRERAWCHVTRVLPALSKHNIIVLTH
jgi:hypothetical protein